MFAFNLSVFPHVQTPSIFYIIDIICDKDAVEVRWTLIQSRGEDTVSKDLSLHTIVSCPEEFNFWLMKKGDCFGS